MSGVASLSLHVVPGAFGAATIEGLVPRSDAADVEKCRMLQQALWTHGVLCIRCDAPLSDDDMRTVVTMIGPIKSLVGRTRAGGTIRYGEDRQIIDAGFVMTDEIRAALGDESFGGDAERPGLFEFFHTDDSYTERPGAATVLHARELPSHGGDTCFIDMRAAFQLLDRTDQQRLVPLRAVHAFNNHDAFPPRASATGALEELVEVAHPVVRRHAVAGTSALYFDLDRATHIAEMEPDEGRALLRSLQDFAEAHAPRYEHAWRPHDVLIWDNSSVQHKASSDFPVGEPRRFWRYMVEGPVPRGVGDPAA